MGTLFWYSTWPSSRRKEKTGGKEWIGMETCGPAVPAGSWVCNCDLQRVPSVQAGCYSGLCGVCDGAAGQDDCDYQAWDHTDCERDAGRGDAVSGEHDGDQADDGVCQDDWEKLSGQHTQAAGHAPVFVHRRV